jgi:hypothetical protein
LGVRRRSGLRTICIRSLSNKCVIPRENHERARSIKVDLCTNG